MLSIWNYRQVSRLQLAKSTSRDLSKPAVYRSVNPIKVTPALRAEFTGGTQEPTLFEVPKVVLSVEDDDAAYFLISSAFQDLGSRFELHRVENGDAALEFLNRTGAYSSAPRPSLILLDMNLPRLTGPEVLARLQSSDMLRDIPVVVFSSSKVEADRTRCLALGAKDFITKPGNYELFKHAIQHALGYAEVTSDE
jgi:two-component system response regulator